MRIATTMQVAIVGILLVFMAACAQTRPAAYIQSARSGFTKEIDEPSSRANLIRISPEQSSVRFRFELSPDEDYIVFSGTQAGGGDRLLQLWKIAAEGGGSPIKITSGGASDFYYPTFTKDGNYIVYASEGQLWKVRSDGAGGKMRIPGTGNGTDTSPHVSSNNKLVFNSVQYANQASGVGAKYLIWTCNMDGGELTQIKEGSQPRWSPDGQKIVFSHQDEIWIVNADGTNLTQLTNTGLIQEALPSFSPDGSRIVYASNEGKNNRPSLDWNVWTMNADGSNKTQITELESWDSWPVWGKKGIYFLSARALQSNFYLQRIWLLKL